MLIDIRTQHAGLQGFNIHKGNAESPQDVEPIAAKGSIEDVTGVSQAKPVDESNPIHENEGHT
jgi:hypothetical protein